MAHEAPSASQPAAQDAPFLTPQRAKLLGIGAAAVLLIAMVAWFFISLGQRKEAAGAMALQEARMAAEQGNFGAAAAQFEQVARDFRGTNAALDANIGLAQIRLIAEQNEGAATQLLAFLKENPPPGHAAPAHGLLGTAYENTGKFEDAAAAYLKAADLATLPYIKVSSLLDAARANRNAGKTDEAVRILRDLLAKYPDTPGNVEAQFMLGELTGGTEQPT